VLINEECFKNAGKVQVSAGNFLDEIEMKNKWEQTGTP
jgi:hypothetical protein